MEQRIQLLHPAGKKAVTMNTFKYDIIRKGLLNYLKVKGEASHEEMLGSLTEDFNKNNLKFQGSVNWHLEWVKLDLEARKIIKRVDNHSPIKFSLV